jgi:hypothetical protein
MQHILGKIWGEATCHDHRVEDEEPPPFMR